MIRPPSAAGLGLGSGSATAEHTRVCKTSCLPGVQLPGVPIKTNFLNSFLKSTRVWVLFFYPKPDDWKVVKCLMKKT